MDRLGMLIRGHIDKLGIDQQEFAEGCELSPSELSRIIGGSRRDLKQSTLLKLSRGLGVTVDELLADGKTPGGKESRRKTGVAAPGKAT